MGKTEHEMQEHCDQANRVEFHEEQEHERKINKKRKQYKNRMEITKQNSVENYAIVLMQPKQHWL